MTPGFHVQDLPAGLLMARRRRSSIDEELKQLDTQIHTLSRREADFQRLLDDLQRMKAETTTEKLGLQSKRNDLEASKEPINWLPTELIIQIFLAFTEFDFEDPQYRPPVVVSHVCSKWRTIAISSPRIWSRIVLQGFKHPQVVQTFLERSVKAPLEVDYCSLPESKPTDECCQAVDFLAKVSPHFGRSEEFTFQSKVALPMVYLQRFINDFTNAFPRLQRLNLAISTANPSFLEAPSLMDREESIMSTKDNASKQQLAGSQLLHLTLEQIPLFNFPVMFVANLRTLDLSFAARKLPSTRYDFYLKMSSLCRFLTLTPLLEELALINTVPFFDVALSPDDGGVADSPDSSPLTRMNAVKLEYLKSIDWTYPFTGDVPRFLSMIEAPVLEKLDLWVEEPPAKRSDMLHVRGYSPTSSAHKYIRGIVSYPILRDLSLQCAGEDTTACVLRKFSLPGLEKVAFTNVDSAAREPLGSSGGGEEPSLPVFPRLESIFRDPRLHCLTHLTLSHFKISLEPGRAESVLGYMPVLTSLSLDSCIGGGRLIEGLQERLVVDTTTSSNDPSATADESRSAPKRGGVKLCPRLEAISIWGCQDVDIDILRGVVLARNGSRTDKFEQEDGPKAASTPNGATPRGGVTRAGEGEGVVASGVRKADVEPKPSGTGTEVGRKIKPLRKPRRHATGSPSPSLAPTTNIVSTLIAMREALQPANIIYLRVANCKLVNQDQAASLRDLGVVDVIWAGSD